MSFQPAPKLSSTARSPSQSSQELENVWGKNENVKSPTYLSPAKMQWNRFTLGVLCFSDDRQALHIDWLTASHSAHVHSFLGIEIQENTGKKPDVFDAITAKLPCHSYLSMSWEYFSYDDVSSFCGMEASCPFRNHLNFSQGSKPELFMNASY